MSWTQRTPSRAALVIRVFMGTPVFTLASRRRIRITLTSACTSKMQLTSYIKPWRAKVVKDMNVTLVVPSSVYDFSTAVWHFLIVLSPLCSAGKVLVHCIMGVSRSATLVLAYLMLRQRLSLRDALKHVIQRRAIYPNRNFLSLLLKLDGQLTLKRRLCPLLWQLSFFSLCSFIIFLPLVTSGCVSLCCYTPLQSVETTFIGDDSRMSTIWWSY